MPSRARALAGLLALVCALGAARPAAVAAAVAAAELPAETDLAAADADTVPCSQLPELAPHAMRVAILGRCRSASTC